VELRTKIATSESEEPVTVRFSELGPVDRTLHAAASPTWIYVLLVLGLAALAFELTQPGFGFAGFAGIAMLALATYGLTVVPFSPVGLGVLLLGIGLMTLDVRLRRLGPLTAAGLVGFAAGSFLVFGGVSDEIDVSPWLIVAFTVMALLYWGFGLTVAIQSRERLTSTQKGLVGLVGETRGELKPEGPVFVKGTLWRGRSAGEPIPQGTRSAWPGWPHPPGRARARPRPRRGSGELDRTPRLNSPSRSVNPARLRAVLSCGGTVAFPRLGRVVARSYIPSASGYERPIRGGCSQEGTWSIGCRLARRTGGSSTPPAEARTPPCSSRRATSSVARRRPRARPARRRSAPDVPSWTTASSSPCVSASPTASGAARTSRSAGSSYGSGGRCRSGNDPARAPGGAHLGASSHPDPKGWFA
jgi:membrane protein implicated in regulation of membrane protease activity